MGSPRLLAGSLGREMSGEGKRRERKGGKGRE